MGRDDTLYPPKSRVVSGKKNPALSSNAEIAAMQHFGNWIQGTQIPFHYGCAHMFVVAADLTEELIQKALQDIDGQGRLKECTMSLD